LANFQWAFVFRLSILHTLMSNSGKNIPAKVRVHPEGLPGHSSLNEVWQASLPAHWRRK
tara:strand:+ start:261 stop:437 length:177 start_codon:yes stop_codon:yes gene_type:complete